MRKDEVKTYKKELKQDWKKIIWPGKKELFKKTAAVIGICLVLAVLIVGIDTASQYGINFVTGLIK